MISTITCYFCGGEASFIKEVCEEDLDTWRYIECPECLHYGLRAWDIFFHFEGENRDKLSQADKKKLSNYVKEHYRSEEGDFVKITKKIMIDLGVIKRV